jgi:hypothetical protein
MFADLGYLQLDDGVSNEEDCNQDLVDEVGIVDIGGLRPWIRIIVLKMVDVSEGSSASMDQALVHLNEIMADITTECTMGASVNLCDHATSLFQGVGSNIHHLGLAQINESMHPRMFHWVDDGFRNSINRMKDWHETMTEHLNTYRKNTRDKERFVTCTHIHNFHLYLTLYTFCQIKLNCAQFALEKKFQHMRQSNIQMTW